MNTNFYQTAATVIPVLFLAITIQSASFNNRGQERKSTDYPRALHALSVIAVMVPLAVVEGLLLCGLYSGKYSIVNPTGAAVPMILATLFIITDYIAAIFDRTGDVGIFYFFIIGSVGATLPVLLRL